MRKIQRAIFFLTPGILMRFLAKKCENIAKSRQKMIPATTSLQHRCNIMTLQRHYNEDVAMLCVCVVKIKAVDESIWNKQPKKELQPNPIILSKSCKLLVDWYYILRCYKLSSSFNCPHHYPQKKNKTKQKNNCRWNHIDKTAKEDFKQIVNV